MLLPADHDNWSNSESSNSNVNHVHRDNGSRREEHQPRGNITRTNSYGVPTSPLLRASSRPLFDESWTRRPSQAPTSPSTASRGVPDFQNSSFSYGRQPPVHSSSISVDINSNNVRHTNVNGVGNTRSISNMYNSSDSESSLSFDDSLSSTSFTMNSGVGTPWRQSSVSGRTPSAVPHRHDNREHRGIAVAGGQGCPGYVVESYRLGDGTMYSSAHACEHDNVHCERMRRQLGVGDPMDIGGEQRRESHSHPRDETSSRTDLGELLGEELRFEDEERDQPPPYSSHPPQASRRRVGSEFTGARSSRQGHENGAFSAFQVVDSGSGYTSQNISIDGDDIAISTRVAHGNNGESTFYSGIPSQGHGRRSFTPHTSYANVRPDHVSGWAPENMNFGSHFPDMSGMSQWIEQMVQQPLRAVATMNQHIAQSNMPGGGWRASVSVGSGNTQFYHVHDGQRGRAYDNNANLPNRSAFHRR